MTNSQLAAFAGVMLLGAMSPGPDFAIVVRRAVTGRGAGLAAAAGVAAGVVVWVAVAVTGAAALLAASATAFTVVKLAGAGYLGYLGVTSLLAAARRPREDAASVPDQAHPGARAAFAQGLLCNVLNPKAAVFFVALMPQFLGPDAGVVDTLLLAAVAFAVVLAWFSTLATLAATLRRILTRPRVRRAVDGLSGAALLGLGARLALSRA
ncbi:MAG: LysE family translocator [Hamadaea sp.]|nr:LysE family translocator [Hamadaea sp.]